MDEKGMIVKTLPRRPPSSAPPQHPLIFLHVPKTAGTTLWLILRREYCPRAVLRINQCAEIAEMTAGQWEETCVILGHIPYGIHELCPNPVNYITVLRDPLEQTLSHYCHWARTSDVPVTLEDYLRASMLWADNIQTRILAGPEAMALPFGACDREVFEAASRNMRDNIAVTGLTERFDETLMLLRHQFGWSLPCYVPENVGENRITREAVPRDLLKWIWGMTQWDRELYALAAGQLDARIAQEGAPFAASLSAFRIANVQYRRMKALVAAGPLQTLKRHLALGGQMGMESAVRHLLDVTHPHGTRHTTQPKQNLH